MARSFHRSNVALSTSMNRSVSTHVPSLSEEFIRGYLLRLEAGGLPSGRDDVRAIAVAAQCRGLLADREIDIGYETTDRLWCNRIGAILTAEIRKRRFGPMYGSLCCSQAPPMMR